MTERQPDLVMIDRALMSLRRFITAPRLLEHQERSVDLSTLLVLDGLPSQGESVREIGERLDVAPSTASRFVTRAEHAGMVTRSPSGLDARAILVTPTKAGSALPAHAADYRLTHLAFIVDDWDNDDVHVLAHALTRFATKAARGPQSTPADL